METPKLSLVEWLEERLANTQRIAASKTGAAREGWLEDGRYFTRAIQEIESLTKDVERQRFVTKQAHEILDNHSKIVEKLEAENKKLREALKAVRPSNRAVGCWCAISRDIEIYGHDNGCLLTESALQSESDKKATQ